MSLTERILDGLKATIQLNDKVVAMAGDVKDLAREVRDMDRRLVRVETAIDLASGGRFAAPGPKRLAPKDD
ncbi:MAG TPA: hypothetical protein VEU47_18485 [Candidatus Cybelea sp.]|nr:hypothetical protein [Candidatus Cybelea sp.]